MRLVLYLCALVLAFAGLPALAQSAETESASSRVARFRDEVRALATDFHNATGTDVVRARRLAYIVVSEAYRYGVPTSLVFGLMMQETTNLDADAVSVAGAQGLMQIMPRIWKPVLGRYFGNDLFDEATNIRYGVWILAHYLHRSGGNWELALERYSGGARQYAERVRSHVERKAPETCPSRSFHTCVVVPVRRAFGR